MTRLLTCGFETGDVLEAGANSIGASMTMTTVSSTPTPHGGNYCLKLTNTAAAFNPTTKTLTWAAAKTEVWVRFAFFAHPIGATSFRMAVLKDTGNTDQVLLTWTATDGLLRVVRTSTTLGTSSSVMTPDAWHVIEWRVQILSATTGTTELWLDGSQVITFSGDVAASTTTNVQSIALGSDGAVGGSTLGVYLAFDDIAVNDVSGSLNNGRPGDGKIILLSPNGAGSSTAWTRGGTDTGANYSQTSELPPSMTQYVAATTVATRDLYALGNLPGGIASINTVEVLAYAQNSDAGAGLVGLTVKSGATTNEGTAQSLGTGAGYIRQQYETDPNTTAAWTTAAVDALEAGATVR